MVVRRGWHRRSDGCGDGCDGEGSWLCRRRNLQEHTTHHELMMRLTHVNHKHVRLLTHQQVMPCACICVYHYSSPYPSDTLASSHNVHEMLSCNYAPHTVSMHHVMFRCVWACLVMCRCNISCISVCIVLCRWCRIPRHPHAHAQQV